MVVDRGQDFPPSTQTKLDSYGSDMWVFRDHPDVSTTRAINSYKGDERRFSSGILRVIPRLNHSNSSFSYLTPRIRITPKDLTNTKLARPATLHVICSPTRAASILSDLREIDGWLPTTIYEPIPVCKVSQQTVQILIEILLIKDSCVPEELPNLINVLPSISVLRYVRSCSQLMCSSCLCPELEVPYFSVPSAPTQKRPCLSFRCLSFRRNN
jgi:hypothetical protein